MAVLSVSAPPRVPANWMGRSGFKEDRMSREARISLSLALIALIASAAPAWAGHGNDPSSQNTHALGHDLDPASLLNPAVGNPDIHTDIAFWGQVAFQGNWDGFRILDISAPGN